jgi:energy-coupling factor transport system permease protein
VRDFTFYRQRDIFLQRLHPTTKIAVAVILMLLVIVVGNDVFFSTGMLAFAGVLLLASRAEWRITKPFFQVAAAFSVLITFSWSFFHREGHPILSLGPFILTDQGSLIIVTVLVRILTLMLLSLFILVSNSESDIIQGLRTARIPYIITFIMMLALKFFPTLIMDHGTIRDAQMARGAEFERGSLLERAKKNVAILAPLIVISFSRAMTMSVAVESRGFSPTGHGIRRTNYRPKRLRARDYAILLALVGFASFTVLARLYLGWFAGVSTTLG